MKKILPFMLALCMVLSCMSIPASAQSAFAEPELKADIKIVEYFEDGSYIEMTISEETAGIMPLADSYVKAGSKTYTYMDSDGNKLWWFTIHGNFRVTTGESAVCTSALHSYSIQDDSWSMESDSATKSGNKAIGKATFIKKVLFITTVTKDISLTLTCDSNGNLS